MRSLLAAIAYFFPPPRGMSRVAETPLFRLVAPSVPAPRGTTPSRRSRPYRAGAFVVDGLPLVWAQVAVCPLEVPA